MALNQKLFDALEKVFGDVKITNEGAAGTYSLPTRKSMCFQRKQLEYAIVAEGGWGEVYHVCCPCCGDSRFRLYFSHLYGGRIHSKSHKSFIYFGKRLLKCWNEQCQSNHKLDEYLAKLDEVYNFSENEVISDQGSPKATPFLKFVSTAIALPIPNYALSDDVVPAACLEYIQRDRGFDPHTLETKYLCRYIPQGATYTIPQVEDAPTPAKKIFVPEGLLIPIICGKQLISWQIRALGENFTGPKYFNAPHADLGRYVYNMDAAAFANGVVICEGATDVWRVMEVCQDYALTGAVGCLGKTLSIPRRDTMKTLWGYDSYGIVLLDADAQKDAKHLVDYLTLYKVFPLGVVNVVLPAGKKDPAKCTVEELRALLEPEFLKFTVKLSDSN